MDLSEIEKTAALAKLDFNPEELSALKGHLDAIFNLFKEINTPEISALKPIRHPVELFQPLREDVAVNCDILPNLEQNAPDFANDFIKVPKVIE